ncbi:hypothetical protein K4F52_004951 [Lecanicillium sp. MT-2017a]|nr:hypothetical protein K4F52_004951 [Lecanicillium sp. MT-2017a]
MSPPNILLLAGAPATSSLDPSKYLDSLSEPFRNFISSTGSRPGKDSTHYTHPEYATWRSLPLTRQPLHTGLTPDHNMDGLPIHAHHQDFFNTASCISSGGPEQASTQQNEDAEDVLTQFYEQSLAHHNPLPSSQLDNNASDDETTAYLDETSFLTTTSFLSNTTSTAHHPPPPVIPPHLSDLEDVPTAPQLLALHPQTITLNLIAGILSIAQPRTVKTRWGKTLSLVEILLGDDTRSGFSATFWLADDSSNSDVTAKMLHLLRRQDVVLLQNVALHVFRGKVYGQSLRRGQTKVHLLWRRRGSGGCYSSRDLASGHVEGANPQLAKTARVKDWVLRFVGADSGVEGKVEVLKGWDKPPDDTQ